jgi:hypothetical protein
LAAAADPVGELDQAFEQVAAVLDLDVSSGNLAMFAAILRASSSADVIPPAAA